MVLGALVCSLQAALASLAVSVTAREDAVTSMTERLPAFCTLWQPQEQRGDCLHHPLHPNSNIASVVASGEDGLRLRTRVPSTCQGCSRRFFPKATIRKSRWPSRNARPLQRRPGPGRPRHRSQATGSGRPLRSCLGLGPRGFCARPHP